VYFKNEWTDQFHKIPFYRFSVKEYMECHNQQIPEWAKIYPERGIFDKKTILVEGGLGTCAESESFDSTEGQVTVIRYFDIGGKVHRKIEIIYPISDDTFVLRQEDSFIKGKWKVTSETRFSKDELKGYVNQWD
jgi:hypothetical protein